MHMTQSTTHTHARTWLDSSGRGIGPSQTPLHDSTEQSQETDIHAPGEIFFLMNYLLVLLWYIIILFL